MSAPILSYAEALSFLSQPGHHSAISQFTRGIERETLRINEQGSLAITAHPYGLGSSLTHEYITTDYAEPLLELITSPQENIEQMLGQLSDLHHFVYQHIDNEYLWPLSMPCYIKQEDDITLAQYGTSNIGQMKHVYRQGLKHRYGSMMQAIAGIHFNFSVSDEFWPVWAEFLGQKNNQDFQSEQYMGLVRNFRRLAWLIPYLFGASPAICQSFLQDKVTKLPFAKHNCGTLYLPFATSLRMSDLGYTSSAQESLAIDYNSLPGYLSSVQAALQMSAAEYQSYSAGEDGVFQQLNKNVLQIENELYAPIRPKQPTRKGEKPSQALAARGISYVEVRVLDIDPFHPLGISPEQIRFLDVFLLYCLIKESTPFATVDYARNIANLNKVVLYGREPNLCLLTDEGVVKMSDWAEQLFTELQQLAQVLDDVQGGQDYQQAWQIQKSKLANSDLTPSGKLLQKIILENSENSYVGTALAQAHKTVLTQHTYQYFSEAELHELAALSHAKQVQLEAEDHVSFAEYLRDYFDNH